MIPPTPSVARALRAEQDAEDERNRAIRAAQKGEHDTDPPVDEDARELAQAYERGRADAVRDAAGYLRSQFYGWAARMIEGSEADRLATKQGAASS